MKWAYLHKGKQTLFLSPAPLSLQSSLSQEIDGWLTSLTALHGLRETIKHSSAPTTYTVFPQDFNLCSTAQKGVNYDAFVVFLSFPFSPSVRKEIKQQVSLVWFFFLFLRLTTYVDACSPYVRLNEERRRRDTCLIRPRIRRRRDFLGTSQ